jgi:hypothetical protein
MIKLTDEEREQLEQEIISLEWALKATDYKIIKSYECELIGEPSQYDVQAVHTERQAQRDRINEIKQMLSEEG